MCQSEPMVDFDAEHFLRVLGEQDLADRDPASPWAGPIDHAAAALVAVGAIAADDARAVLAEYGCEPPADENAGDGWVAGRWRRVVALNTDLRLRSGTLRLGYGLLGDDETAIAASYRADPGHAGIYHDWIRVPSGWPSGLQPPLLTDDRGRAAALTFQAAETPTAGERPCGQSRRSQRTPLGSIYATPGCVSRRRPGGARGDRTGVRSRFRPRALVAAPGTVRPGV
ncbi:MAG: hypothetical protein M3076_01025 [Actinomycetota bacterium]|nr:hypothetical protein [Actinomycetota bacterium]